METFFMEWQIFKKARKVSGQLVRHILWGEDEAMELKEWQQESSQGSRMVDLFSDPENRTALLKQFEDNDKQEAVVRLRRHLRKSRSRRILLRYSKVAAMVLFALGGVLLLRYRYGLGEQETLFSEQMLPGRQQATLILSNGEMLDLTQVSEIKETEGIAIVKSKKGELTYTADSSNSTHLQYNTIIVPRYGEYSVILADGTRVKLNSESELRYPVAFTGTQREVYLKGEAYLEVSRSRTPFIVHVYDAEVKVYGTSFDINSYDPENINVVLVEGKVGVRSSRSEEVLLFPDQVAKITAEDGITVKKNINVNYYIAWQEGYFAFEEERLEDIMRTLSRWYQMEVLFENPQLKDIRFTASIQKEEDVGKLLKQFELTQSISFKISGNQIVIK